MDNERDMVMRKLLLALGLLLFCTPAFAAYTDTLVTVNDIEGNTIYIGTATSGTPFVQFNSTTSGILLPEMTTTQMDAISGAQLGELLFNTSNTQFYFYNGSSWATVGAATTSGSTLLAGNGGGGIANVTIGSGLTYNSLNTTLSLSTTSWIPNNIQVFSTSGTWTQPTGITKVYVKLWGSGGGGGGSNGSTYYGGGGGMGGYAEGVIAVTGNVTVTVDQGGAGGDAANGTAGGTTSFAGTTTIQSTGGGGGVESLGSAGNGGSGGVGSGGSFNLTGASGASGSSSPPPVTGVFGLGTSSVNPATAGLGTGAGGTGSKNTGGATGGAGSAGLVVVYY